jgi:ATP-binding protein involved in chromosome partitioning
VYSPPGKYVGKWFSTLAPGSVPNEKVVLQHLSVIIDPDLNRDIVSLGFVKNLSLDTTRGHVAFDLELTTPACPVKDQFVEACERVLKENLPWVKSVSVKLTARERKSSPPGSGPGLARVQSIIAVGSCKGGVGKSSVAYNLALTLSKSSRVGLLDLDIYGPSLPTLIPNVVKAELDQSMPQQIQPFEGKGMKLMSIGYLKPGESVALRGPMISGLAQQLLTLTGWGELDYLVIDLPPGTGDIQLTVGQHAKIDGSVVVTTPQELSIVDVEKGINLFNKLQIPSIALVENFSYFKCGKCDERHEIFGRTGAGRRVAEKYGIDNVVELPIDPKLSSEETELKFKELSEILIREISKLKFSEIEINLKYENNFINLIQNEEIIQIAPRKLRLDCRSATMIDEWTGEKLFKESDIPIDVFPVKIEKSGNYAFRIDWSDGHHSIYPIKQIKELILKN